MPRWHTRRESGLFRGTGRERCARGLAHFWLRIPWWRNIRLRPRSTEERRSPSWSCNDSKRNQKIDGRPNPVSEEMHAALLCYTRRVPIANQRRGVLMKALKNLFAHINGGRE